MKSFFPKSSLSCPLCLSKKFKKYYAMPKYSLAKCNNCSMVWDYQASIDPESFYNKDYFFNDNTKGGYANYVEGMTINKKTFALRLKRFEQKIGKKGKILDVGCALGDFLLEAKRLGWKKSYGLERSDYAYKYCLERKLNVKKGSLAKVNYPHNDFDLIVYQDVVEHLHDPLGEIKVIKKYLAPGGYIFLVTPDIGGLWRRLLGKYWYHYKPKEHVCYFSQKTLNDMLRKAGYSDIQTKKTYHVLNLEYIFNRLRYYSPAIFSFLHTIIKATSLKKVSFKLYIGEIEAWGKKNA